MPEYKVNEIFYSLQGEGRWSGAPMIFIRFYGCNLDCEFCDTPQDAQDVKIMSRYDILHDVRLLSKDCERICFTGGEPLLQPKITELKEFLFEEGYAIHLETNGTYYPEGHWSWITVSPKSTDIDCFILGKANEVKFLCGQEDWKLLVNTLGPVPHRFNLLMPIADGKSLNDKNTQLAIQYCLEHPQFSLCLQMHKYLNIQ